MKRPSAALRRPSAVLRRPAAAQRRRGKASGWIALHISHQPDLDRTTFRDFVRAQLRDSVPGQTVEVKFSPSRAASDGIFYDRLSCSLIRLQV